MDPWFSGATEWSACSKRCQPTFEYPNIIQPASQVHGTFYKHLPQLVSQRWFPTDMERQAISHLSIFDSPVLPRNITQANFTLFTIWKQKSTPLIVWVFYGFMITMVVFLSDPSPIIGYACHSLTHSLTDCCLVNLMAMNDTNCLMMSQQPLKAVKRFLRLKKLCRLSATAC